MNDLLADELRRVAAEDPALRDAIEELATARAALVREMSTSDGETASVEISPDGQDLPFAAQRVFAVRIGRTPWSHALTGRTFTLADVSGAVRGLEVECGEERRRLDFQAEVEWTLPAGARECVVLVNAKRNTRFTFFEFP
jgi:hypothetical protein